MSNAEDTPGVDAAMPSEMEGRKEDSREGEDQDKDEERRGPPGNVDDMFTVKVDNIPFNSTPEQVRALFEEFGEIGDTYIPRFKGRSKGFAFVRFLTKENAEAAVAGSQGKSMEGREIRVQLAERPRNRDRPPRRDDRGRRDGSSRREYGRGRGDSRRDREYGRDRDYGRRERDYGRRDRDYGGRDSGRDRDRDSGRDRDGGRSRNQDYDRRERGRRYNERSRSPQRSRSPERR